MNEVIKLLDAFYTELRSNNRLRLGIWGIVLIMLFYLVLIQSDRLDREMDAYAMNISRSANVLTRKDQEGWLSLLREEKKISKELRTHLWQADTLGVAQASLQQSIKAILANLDVRNPRVRFGTAQPLTGATHIWQVQAQIDAHYSRGDEVSLLHDLAAHPNKMVVDRLELDSLGNRLLVQVSAYFEGLDAG